MFSCDQRPLYIALGSSTVRIFHMTMTDLNGSRWNNYVAKPASLDFSQVTITRQSLHTYADAGDSRVAKEGKQ
ncbi:hypothetical protein SOMG_02213 [Schizosaccharomyces osmophilus]|uniref:Uncharacterized protein n=1 Tax=Schizosaccharomyces osmophilus TaxID=2545709 RepID=A0AAF0AS48_9SCHI|nr:uncharacterized protein SOMG_02213 [Schizosaccharomyces osmophilus]WBW70816.1 hypothetical protein SOMG_02213 [Schizosaccharomyces osmophilus]